MSGNFRHYLQAVMLYDGDADVSPSRDLKTFCMAMQDNGMPLKIIREGPQFVLMTGSNELQLTCSYHNEPANPELFSLVPISPFLRMLVPDGQERVQRHRSHVLIEVQQGALGVVEDIPEIASFLSQIHSARTGNDLVSFNRRVKFLANACCFLHKVKPASALLWTQSKMLISGQNLEGFLNKTDPGPLTIHPMIVGGAEMPGYKQPPVELYTIGAADYIGREIHTDLAPIPWVDIFESILAFVRMAIMPNGYIIPDGDTFGIESGEFSWRVSYLDGSTQKTINGNPYYNLKLLYHRKHGYTAPDFMGRELIEGGIPEASSQLDGPEDARREQITAWEKAQDLAQKAGGRFEIYRTNDPAPTVGISDAPRTTPFGSNVNRTTPVFGKKKT